MIICLFLFKFGYTADSSEITLTVFNEWSRDGTDFIGLTNVSDTYTFWHTGIQDYSIMPAGFLLLTNPGDIYKVSVDIKASKCGNNGISLSVATVDSDNNVISWLFNVVTYSNISNNYEKLMIEKIIIPYGVYRIIPRFTGTGSTNFVFKNFKIERSGEIPYNINKTEYSVESNKINFTYNTVGLNFSVYDKRSDRLWMSKTTSYSGLTLIQVNDSYSNRLDLKFSYKSQYTCNANFVLTQDDELEFNISCPTLNLNIDFYYPPGIIPSSNDRIILPINEGFTFMANDFSHGISSLITYGGHGLCMSFMGIYDDSDYLIKKSGIMMIINTPNDFNVYLENENNCQILTPVWKPELGAFGYTRSIRYVFFDQAKHVEMCKRYREYANQTGLLVPFKEKQKLYPDVQFDKLIGAANIWIFGSHRMDEIYEELQSMGVDRILASQGTTSDMINKINNMSNTLTSRYDIYNGILDPAIAQWTSATGTPDELSLEAWPEDIMWKDSQGNYHYDWSTANLSNSSQMIDMAVICDKKTVRYCRETLEKELPQNKYTCRFIDTVTASPWRECYHPNHTITRSQSRYYKMELLKLMHKNNLVCGSETGHEAAVPYCDYFEGMMSLAHFRVPNSGRYLQFIWENDLPIPLPEFITKFQVGQDYRLPLFELVFHDCLVSYWYLGDYNNKIPSVWEKRDLFNMLYGVPPMYLFGEDTYKRFKEQIVESYKVAQPISRETGYSEMTDFIILSNDRSVQRSVFDNGVSVTCNFGSKTYKLEDGTKLKSMTAIKGTFQKKSSTGMIVGIVIGVLIVIVIIVVVSILVIRKKRTQNEFKPAL